MHLGSFGIFGHFWALRGTYSDLLVSSMFNFRAKSTYLFRGFRDPCERVKISHTFFSDQIKHVIQACLLIESPFNHYCYLKLCNRGWNDTNQSISGTFKCTSLCQKKFHLMFISIEVDDNDCIAGTEARNAVKIN